MIKQLAVFERTACDCGACRQICTGGKPGALCPSDIDAISDLIGVGDEYEAFYSKMFEPTEDGPKTATEQYPDGETPAIRPRTRPNGECVFLGEHGCTISEAMPFECSRVNACDPAAGAAAMKALGRSIVGSVDYTQLWLWMREHN